MMEGCLTPPVLISSSQSCKWSAMEYLSVEVTEVVPDNDDLKFKIFIEACMAPENWRLWRAFDILWHWRRLAFPCLIILSELCFGSNQATLRPVGLEKTPFNFEVFDMCAYIGGKDKVIYYILKHSVSLTKELYA